MSIELDNITSGYNLSKINSNFQKLEDTINDKLLWTEGSLAGETLMERDLDMNGFKILNADLDGSSITNDRAIRVDVGEAALEPLPGVDFRKGKLLGFDPDDGLPTVFVPVSGSAADVLMMLAANEGASLIGEAGGGSVQDAIDGLQDGTSIKYHAYTFTQRLDEEYSVGAVAGVDKTGVLDSTAALQAFFDSLPNGSEVYIPPGTYKTSGLVISNNSLKIRGGYEYAYGQSTTKFKAASANNTLFTFTGNGCYVEHLLFEGFEAAVNFGATETCTGIKFQPNTGTLADIDSFVHNCVFFCLKNGTQGFGRNLTQRNNLFSHVALPTTLTYVAGQQFRGHVIDDNRFHSCGGLGATTDASLANSVCIKLVANPAVGVLADNYAGNISIRNNKCDGGCYQFFLGAFHRGSIMSNNDIFRCGGAGATVIRVDNSATVSNTDYDNFVISNNVLASDLPVAAPQQFPDYALWLTAVRGGVVSGNAWSKLGKHGIVLDNSADLILSSNQIKNPNINVATNGITFNAIEIANGGNNIQILGLNVRNTQAPTQYQYVVNNASATNVMIDNVQANGYSAFYNEGASARLHGFLNFGGQRRKEVQATAVSTLTTGNFAVGDICWFTAFPGGTAYIGAVCVGAGTGLAATWRNFGALV